MRTTGCEPECGFIVVLQARAKARRARDPSDTPVPILHCQPVTFHWQ